MRLLLKSGPVDWGIAYHRQNKSKQFSYLIWGYYYAQFLLPYNLSSFTDFDFWGEIPKNEEAKQVVDNLIAA